MMPDVIVARDPKGVLSSLTIGAAKLDASGVTELYTFLGTLLRQGQFLELGAALGLGAEYLYEHTWEDLLTVVREQTKDMDAITRITQNR